MIRAISFLFILFAGSNLVAQAQKKEWISLHGNVGLSLGSFASSGFQGRQPGFYWSLSGNPVLTIFGVPMPISVMLSNQGKSISAPFSQLGISPTFKWAKFHLGTRSLNFSPFSIAGHTFLGAAVELNPGSLRFALLGGRFQKARELDSTSVYRARPSYGRLGYGCKLGFGSDRSHLDFIYFRAKDDPNSLPEQSRQYKNLTPDENMVIGLSSRIAFGKHLNFYMDGGASVYTEDVRTELLVSDSETSLTDLEKTLTNLYPLRNGTSLSFAGEAGLRYQSKVFQLGLNYRRVEPEYRSMGAWFFQTDVQQFTINPGLSLRKGKTRLQCNLGVQSDDLLHLKPNRSKRIIGGVSISMNPSERFGIDIQVNNFQFTQENNYLDSDSLRLQQATRFVNISPHWTQRSGDYITTWSSSLNYQLSDDYNPYTKQKLHSDFVFGQLQMNRQDIKKGLNVGLGVNARLNKSNLIAQDQQFGILANASKMLFEKKCQLMSNMNGNIQVRKGHSAGFSIGWGFGISYKLRENLKANVNAYYLNNVGIDRKYQFLNTNLGIDFTF